MELVIRKFQKTDTEDILKLIGYLKEYKSLAKKVYKSSGFESYKETILKKIQTKTPLLREGFLQS